MIYLWFDNQAEEAMKFYVELFNGSPAKHRKPSKIISITRHTKYPKDSPLAGSEGKVLTGVFELDGKRYTAIDGGSSLKFTDEVCMTVECNDQEEVDYFWNRLSADPDSEQCGWLRDKFGMSWQVMPRDMSKYMDEPNEVKQQKILEAMMQMKKFDIQKLNDIAASQSVNGAVSSAES